MNRATESKSTSWKCRLGVTRRQEEQSKLVGQPDDLVIVIVGLTGAGKSTFIRDFTGDGSVIVGHRMDPCTREVTWYHAPIPPLYAGRLGQRRLILVDTPGFDDSYLNESEILHQVARWLTRSYDANKVVTGIVYLNDITLQQVFGSSRMDLSMLTKLCGESDCKKVVLATSKWDCCLDTLEGSQQEQELRVKLWGAALERGAKVMKIQRKPDDLCAIVSYLVESRIGCDNGHLESENGTLGSAIPTPWPRMKQPIQGPAVEVPATNAPRSDDIIIAILGQIGAGKSTFINSWLGEGKAEVGNGLTQCTHHISRYTASRSFPHQGRRIVLVDTPGLDDIPNERDYEIMRRLAIWMATSCSTGADFAGVLYLQNIKQKRGCPGASSHLKDFKRLARASFNNSSLDFSTAFVTTQWDGVGKEAGTQRERELKGSFWKELTDDGASVYRADGPGSQVQIVNQFLGWS